MSEVVIAIKDASVETRSVRTKTGDATFSQQTGWIVFPSGEVRKIRVSVPRGQEPYKVGQYVLGPNSFEVGQWGDLQLSRQLELLLRAPVAARQVG